MKKEEPLIRQEEEAFVKGLEETQDLMTKMNPSQIDIYQAAFGVGVGEDETAVFAQFICKKIQSRVLKHTFDKSQTLTKHDDKPFSEEHIKRKSKTTVDDRKDEADEQPKK